MAQKFTRTTLPVQLALDTTAPEISRSGKGGAISGSFTKRMTGGLSPPVTRIAPWSGLARQSWCRRRLGTQPPGLFPKGVFACAP